MNDALKEAIAAFVAASARFKLAENAAERTRLCTELHTHWHELARAWEQHAPTTRELHHDNAS